MDNVICLSSWSSSTLSEKRFNYGEEEDIDMIPSSNISESIPSKTSATSPNPNSTSLFKGDSNFSERLTSEERALSAKERAKETQLNLDRELPSFVKSLRPSHVNGESRLRLPSPFCNSHLPEQSAKIMLIDENQKEYIVKYHEGKKSLTCGWKELCVANGLVEGDAVIFQLIRPIVFQVYIVKAYSMAEKKIHACQKPIGSWKRNKTSERTVESHQESLQFGALKKPEEDKSRYAYGGSEEVGSEVSESIRISETSFDLKDINSLESFTILVNGLSIDSNLTEQTRRKYYDLCCSQNVLLHENLLGTPNSMLAAGLISEIINISESIRASKLNTAQEQFAGWDKNLRAFEQLGMNVGFLRARIRKLVRLICKSEEDVDLRRYREAIDRRDDVKVEIEMLKAKLVQLKEASKRFKTEIDTLELKVEQHELKYRAQVNAPW